MAHALKDEANTIYGHSDNLCNAPEDEKNPERNSDILIDLGHKIQDSIFINLPSI